MSEKDCGHHNKNRRRKIIRRIFAGTLIFLFVVLLTILIIWAILKPQKPKFILQDATVYNFNLTSPSLLTSTFQVTVLSRNANDRIGVYYDRLVIYGTYRDQQITFPTDIPPAYQDTNAMNIWSPFITGKSVPIAPFIGQSLGQDQSSGSVYLLVKLDGKVRWKVGSFTSGTYRLHVTCPANIAFGNPNVGIKISNTAVKYQLENSCSVSV